MNSQLLLDELRELAEVMRDYAEESRSVGSERLESYYVGKAVAFEEAISMIESSLVPAIKPGDKARHSDLGDVVVVWVGDNIAEVAVGMAHYDVSLKDLEVVE